MSGVVIRGAAQPVRLRLAARPVVVGLAASAAALSIHEALTAGAHGITAYGAALVSTLNAAAARTVLDVQSVAQAASAHAATLASANSYSDSLAPNYDPAGSAAAAQAASQPLDADLTAIAALTTTAFGRGLLTESSAATARSTLSVPSVAEVAAGYQPLDAELTAIAGLTSAADRLPYFTGSGTASLATFTAFGRNLVDDANAAAGRTTLGLGTIATQSAASVAITGGTINGLTSLAVLGSAPAATIAPGTAVLGGGSGWLQPAAPNQYSMHLGGSGLGTVAPNAARLSVILASAESANENIPTTFPAIHLHRFSSTLGTFIKMTNGAAGFCGIGAIATAANNGALSLWAGAGVAVASFRASDPGSVAAGQVAIGGGVVRAAGDGVFGGNVSAVSLTTTAGAVTVALNQNLTWASGTGRIVAPTALSLRATGENSIDFTTDGVVRLFVGGTGIVSIPTTTASTSTTTGALMVAGGVGIVGSLYSGLGVFAGSDPGSVATGQVAIGGGVVRAAGNIVGGGSLAINGALTGATTGAFSGAVTTGRITAAGSTPAATVAAATSVIGGGGGWMQAGADNQLGIYLSGNGLGSAAPQSGRLVVSLASAESASEAIPETFPHAHLFRSSFTLGCLLRMSNIRAGYGGLSFVATADNNGVTGIHAGTGARVVTFSSLTTAILQTTASTSTTTGALTVAGGVGVGGAIIAGGTIRCTGGDASAPGFSFIGDTNTGIYQPATDALAIGCGGAQAVRISAADPTTVAAGQVAIGGGVLRAAGGIHCSSPLDADGPAYGSVTTLGGIAAVKNIYCGTNLSINTDDGFAKVRIDSKYLKPTIEFGPGTSFQDTNLYRDSANVLKTDDRFIAVGTDPGSVAAGQVAIGGGVVRAAGAIHGASFNVSGIKVIGAQGAAVADAADDESAAYTGIDNAQAGSVYAQLSDLNALRVAYENLRAQFNTYLSRSRTHGLIAT